MDKIHLFIDEQINIQRNNLDYSLKNLFPKNPVMIKNGITKLWFIETTFIKKF